MQDNICDVFKSYWKPKRVKWWIKELKFEYEKVFEEDVLNYELIFDFWMKLPGVMCIRYDALPLYKHEIELFFMQKVDWLEWQPHEYVIDADIRKQISGTYKSLIHKVGIAEKYKINEG